MTAWHRLHAATLELVGSAPIKQRLSAAYSNQLRFIENEELPDELRGRFQEIASALQSVKPLPGETAVQATVRKMSPAEADRCATMIVELLGELGELVQAQLQAANRAPRDKRDSDSRDSDTVVPLFAAEA
jgi:hypothetical protein